jgi:hypothetical protein
MRDYLAAFYPQARMELVKLADNSPIYMRVELPREQIAAAQGLTEHITYSDGVTEERTAEGVEFASGDASVKHVVWQGALKIADPNEYAPHTQGGLQVFLDEQPWSAPRYLGRGLYSLRIEWNGQGEPKFEWQTANVSPAAVPAEALFNITPPHMGLLGEFYANDNWEGAPRFHQIAPFLMYAWTDAPPIAGNQPFTVRFRGALRVTEPGKYRIRIIADDGARLKLDDKVVGEAMQPGGEQTLDVNLELSQGDHPMVLEYFQKIVGSSLRVYWQKDDAPMVPIPPSALVPAQP